MRILLSFLLLGFPLFSFCQTQGDGYNFTAPEENGLSIPHTADIGMTTDFTVELWVRPRAIENQMCLLQKGWCGSSDFTWNLVINVDSTVSFTVNDQGNCNFSSSYQINTQLIPGNCTHIAIVYQSTSIEAYFDGVLQSGSWVLNSHPGVLHASSGNINVGRYYTWGGAWDLYYDGLMDELRIWNDVRTSQEIQDMYVNPLVGDEQGLMVYYNFDGAPAGTGSTITNNSVNTGTSLDGDLTSLSSLTPAVGSHTCFLGLADESIKYEFTVSPNPSDEGVIFVSANEINFPMNFTLYDISGKLVYSVENVSLPFQLNVDKYEAGVYTYEFKSTNGQSVNAGKLVVK